MSKSPQQVDLQAPRDIRQLAPVKVTLLGAAGEVTGSCYLVETSSARILIDCGMFQGSRKIERLNHIPRLLAVQDIDAVVLTHAHLDHSGRLPLLVKSGYRGPIFATDGTIDIVKLILEDAAKIQCQDAEHETRIRKRAGLSKAEPLFTPRDVERVCAQMRSIQYDSWHDLTDGITVKLVEAGHILGSSSVLLRVTDKDLSQTIVFSGDLGAWGSPIVRDPACIDTADTVFIESTYGDRDHRPLDETVAEFEELITTAVKRKGKILIPTFAVGRTQQILYHLAAMFREHKVKRFPIYLDSPMAIAATQLYTKHQELMDEEAVSLHSSGQLKSDLTSVIPCPTADQSRALNTVTGPCIILAGAGMCNAGRILHHLRHNLSKPETVVMIVGYQTRGSFGRFLVDGATSAKIFGETVPVRAKICTLGGFSAHAGQTDLLRWLSPMAKNNPRVIITHGEEHQRHQLAYKIRELYDINAEMPKMFETLSL